MFSRISAAGARLRLHVRAKTASPSTRASTRISRMVRRTVPTESSSTPLAMKPPRIPQMMTAAIARKANVTTLTMIWIMIV